MWEMSSSSFALATTVLFFFLNQGVTGESACRLLLSRSNQSLAVQIGSTGQLNCQISPECNLTSKRVLGPFWRRPNGDWFTPNMRMSNTEINSTTISLRYVQIIHQDLGIYRCIARIGRETFSVAANITKRQGNKGDVPITPGPEGSTRRPQKRKRSVDESFKSFEWAGLAREAPYLMNQRNRRVARRSLQGPTRDSRQGNPPQTGGHPAERNHGSQPLETPCNGEEKLFSKTGIIIVAALVCSTFLLLYMVILLMAVPRICFPYYPKKKSNTSKDERSADPSKNKESSTKVDIPLSHKVRPNGRSDSGIESVDGLEERGSQHGGGRTRSHWEIGTDRLEEFYRRTTNEEAGSDDDMLSGLKRYNIEKDIPRRGRSESVPVTPYRYQSSIYVKV